MRPPDPLPTFPPVAAAAEPVPKPEPKKSPPRWRRRLTIALAVLLPALGVLAFVVYEHERPAPAAFRTVRVTRADITERVTATGTVQPVVTSPVGAQVSGIVWKLHADYNSAVKAGDLLVELDPALFRNAVALATAQLAQAEASLTGARATALGAQAVRDRTLELHRASLVSTADLDAAQAVFGQTSGLSRSGSAQIAEARAQLDRARLDLEHSVIRSPVDGTVIARNIELGQAVAATLTAPTLFTIARDLGHMQVHAAVDEADIGQVRAGQEATFTVDAFRELTFTGVVHEVRNAPQTAQNVVTYDVVIDVENPEGKLRPGMTANVLILIEQRMQVMAIPNEALRFRPAAVVPAPGAAASSSPAGARLGAAVFVPRGREAVRTPVHLGLSDGNLTEVSGLAADTDVIVEAVRDRSARPTGGSPRGL